MPEPALLAFQNVGKGLQAALLADRGLGQGLALSHAVVDEGVNRLLKHSLLVPGDDLRGFELKEVLQPVVPVDDPAVKVVQVRGGEAAPVQLDHRPQSRRDDRDDLQEHPLRPGPRIDETPYQPQAAAQLLYLQRLVLGVDLRIGFFGHLLQVELLKDALDGLGPDADLKDLAVLQRQFPELELGYDLVPLYLLEDEPFLLLQNLELVFLVVRL